MEIRDIILLIIDERVVVIGIDSGSIENAIVVQVMEHSVVAIHETTAYHGVYVIEGLYLLSFYQTNLRQVDVNLVALAGHFCRGLFLGRLCGGSSCCCSSGSSLSRLYLCHIVGYLVYHMLMNVVNSLVGSVMTTIVTIVKLYMGSYQTAIVCTLASRHIVPLFSGIGAVGIAMPGEHATRA